MKTYEATIESVSPLIFSRMLSPHAGEGAKKERETHEDYDLRIWPVKAWADNKGALFIPRVFFKRSMEEAAQFLGLQIPGKGKSTYTKHFLAGVQVASDLSLPMTRDDLDCVPINCHADGKRGSGKRVVRHFPQVREWNGVLTILVVDELITKDVLQRHLDTAGTMIGIGSFRPRSGNSSGMFHLKELREVA